MKSWGNVILAFSLLPGPVAVGQRAEERLLHADFADGRMVEGQAQVADWTGRVDAGTGQIRWEAQDAPSAPGCVVIEMTEQGQADWRLAFTFLPLEPDQAYEAEVAVWASTVEPGSHSLELQWFDAQNHYLSRSVAAATELQTWQVITTGPVAPPTEATQVALLLRAYHPGTYRWDNVRLTHCPAAEADQVGNLLTNPSVERDDEGDGLPDGWSRADGTPSENAPWDPEVAATGKRSLKLTSEDAALRPAWERTVPVQPGAACCLAAQVKSDVFGRDFRLVLQFINDVGNGRRAVPSVLDEAFLADQTFAAWQRKSLIVTAPEAPGPIQALVRLELASAGTIWFDDLSLSVLADAQQLAVDGVRLELLAPRYRGLIDIQNRPPEIVAAAHLMEALWPRSVRFTLRDAGTDEPLAEGTSEPEPPDEPSMEGRHAVEWRTPATDLPLGAYTLTATVHNDEGEALAQDQVIIDVRPNGMDGIRCSENNVVVVEGEPFFPIGVTSLPLTEESLADLERAGFNLIVPGTFTVGEDARPREQLDLAAAHGLKVIEWNNGFVYPPGGTSPEERAARLRESVANVGDHPAFLGWMADETLWNGVPYEDVRHAYDVVRRAAPTKIFWQNHAPRNTIEEITLYNRAADVSGVDIYPVEGADHSNLPNKTLSVVGDEIDKLRQTVADRKPIWAILQGFGWNAWEQDESRRKRPPTWAETRFMAYNAITHGATGIIYWGASYMPRDGAFWDDLRRMAAELRQLAPILASGQPVSAIQAQPADGPVGVLARQYEGRLYVIAVNEQAEPTVAKIVGLPPEAGIKRLFEESPPPAFDGVLTDEIEGYGVRMYEVSLGSEED